MACLRNGTARVGTDIGTGSDECGRRGRAIERDSEDGILLPEIQAGVWRKRVDRCQAMFRLGGVAGIRSSIQCQGLRAERKGERARERVRA